MEKRINAVYFINVIDEHLAKVAGVDFSFKDASLKKIVSSYTEVEPRTMGAQRSRLLEIAREKGDAFAKAFCSGKNWQDDSRAFGHAQELRNSLAHGFEINEKLNPLFNEFTPGYDFDDNGYFTMSDEMAAAFALIKPRRVVNDVELLPLFKSLECAFDLAHRASNQVFISTAKYCIAAHLSNRFEHASRRQIQQMWKVNNIRNRYAHTGRITAAERAYVERVAKSYGVEF